MYSPHAQRIYSLDKGAPVAGVAYGDFLLVEPGTEYPYLLYRALTPQEGKECLASDGCRYLPLPDSYGAERPHLELVR